jgi:hypothetical protein
MAHAVDDVQMGTLNSDKIHSCFRPEFASFDVCAPDRVAGYIAELRRLADDLRSLHQGLFLGETKLQPFKDDRLLVRAVCVCCVCAARAGARRGLCAVLCAVLLLGLLCVCVRRALCFAPPPFDARHPSPAAPHRSRRPAARNDDRTTG